MENNLLEFFVKDTGIGIPENQLGAVFQRFSQVETDNTRNYEGTGLGLPISRSLAQLMGGDMYVTSNVGEGSTFSFTIAYQPCKAWAYGMSHMLEVSSKYIITI